MESRAIFVLEVRGRRIGHPDWYVESLAARRHQVVGRGWPSASLTNPQRLTRERVERIVNPRVLGIRILLMVVTT